MYKYVYVYISCIYICMFLFPTWCVCVCLCDVCVPMPIPGRWRGHAFAGSLWVNGKVGWHYASRPTLIASLIMKKIGLDLQWTIKLHHAHYSILYVIPPPPHMRSHTYTHIVRKYRTSSHKNKSFIGMLSLTRSLTIKCPTSLSTVQITHTHTHIVRTTILQGKRASPYIITEQGGQIWEVIYNKDTFKGIVSRYKAWLLRNCFISRKIQLKWVQQVTWYVV